MKVCDQFLLLICFIGSCCISNLISSAAASFSFAE
uniref:Uncharacterized protein n=1 Tax=Arundo donax TaxID=35708 RepID=A0A0A9GX50_ARUDO